MMPVQCYAVLLVLSVTDPSYNVATDPVLGMDGKWTVPDWDRLAQFENKPFSPEGSSACIARELRERRQSLPFTPTPDTTCRPGEFNPSPVVEADPVMRACDPRTPPCRPGQTCS